MYAIGFIIGFISFIVTIIMRFVEFNCRSDHNNINLLFGIWVFFPSSAINIKILKLKERNIEIKSEIDINNITIIIDICYMVFFAASFIVYSINPLLNFITTLN